MPLNPPHPHPHSYPARSGRSWYTGLALTGRTVMAVLAALRTNRLAALIPVAVVLFLTAALLWFVHLVSPLAPFVYSLF